MEKLLELHQEFPAVSAIHPETRRRAVILAEKIVLNEGRYRAVVAGTNVPWWFVAVLHAVEADLDFTGIPHENGTCRGHVGDVANDRFECGGLSTWEERAREAVVQRKLTGITDWSLPSALYNWRRLRNRPNTNPRGWVPHALPYRKPRPDQTAQAFPQRDASGRVGAVLVLSALVDIGAVTLNTAQRVLDNPAVMTARMAEPNLDLAGPTFRHVATELEYPGPLGPDSEWRTIKSTQEWLNLHGCAMPIDGRFSSTITDRLRLFQTRAGRQPAGQLDPETWALLTAPMGRVLAKIDHGDASFEEAVLRVAKQHLQEAPVEVGGPREGPWVRLYMQGEEGEPIRWSAGFVCFVISQAARDLAEPMPFARQVGIDSLVNDADAACRFIHRDELPDSLRRKSKLRPGMLFCHRSGPNHWSDAGFVLGVGGDCFTALEANCGGGDYRTVCRGVRQAIRSYANVDFVCLL